MSIAVSVSYNPNWHYCKTQQLNRIKGTRSYAIGADTETVTKNSLKPTRRRWDEMFDYIASTPALSDIVISGGDAYYLTPDQLYDIGTRLLAIPHIRRFRFATKGLAVCPSRILDPTDSWTSALVAVSNAGRKRRQQGGGVRK